MDERENYNVGTSSHHSNNSFRLPTSLISQMVSSDSTAEEFEEEDIWAVDSKNYRFKFHNAHNATISSRIINRKPRENGGVNAATATPRRLLPTASRMIPRSNLHEEGVNIVPTSSWRPQSAPINIPDWSQIYSRRGGGQLLDRGRRNPLMEDEDDEDEDEEKGEGDGIVPPHELVARQFARSQMTPFSMCEGAGRTLKGRDLSRVRNAILTRTGFLD